LIIILGFSIFPGIGYLANSP